MALLRRLNLKTTLAVVLIAGLAAGFLTNLPVNAAGPQFNIFPITYTEPSSTDFLDYPLIDARRVGGSYSTSQSDHDDGVTVNPGDEIEFSVYYHNGTVDDPANTAINTIVKAFSNPSLGSPDTTHWVAASIEANNAAFVSSDDPARGGSMKIEVAGGEPQSLSLVPGTTKQFKNWGSRNPQNGSPDISQQITLPNTVFSSGVNLGDVRGCWPFFGFVSFRLKVSSTALTRNLTIQKQVLNATRGETSFVDSTTALENDIVRYRVVVGTTGNGSQTNVIVSDVPNSRTQFVSGDDLRSTGVVNMGTVNPNETLTFTYDARVTGTTAATLVNTAKVRSTEVTEKTDTASVVVGSLTRNLTIQKKVLNATNNESTFVESTNAREGDIVRYQIVIGTTGNGSQTNVTVTDVLNSRLQFNGGDDLRGSGLNLGTLSANESRTLQFEAVVLGSTAITITNTARVRSTEVLDKTDTASVVVSSVIRDLTIQKKVRNLTNNETSLVESTNAKENDIVEYQVLITATGTGSQTNIIVTDALHTRLEWNGGDDPRGAGLNIGSLTPVDFRIVTYQVKILGSTAGTIVNTAKVKSDQVTIQKQDTASVVVASLTRNLTIQKKVRNLTNGESSFVESTNAKENDIVEYEVVITATGNGSQTNVIATDTLHSRLEFSGGDDLRGVGVNLGEFSPNESRTLNYQARILGSTATTITNTAKVKSDQVIQKQDTASVVVASLTRNLTIQKKVRNLTNGESSFVESTNAKENDIVEYEVVITSTGNGSQTNVTVTDILHSRIEFQSGDDLRSGLNIGGMSANDTRTLRFEARVLGATATTITNTARVRSTEVTEKTDTASVKVGAVKASGDLTERP